MAKQTWVNVNGQWKKVKSVWVNVNGTWKKDVMPKGMINGNWKEFMSYGFKVLNELTLGGYYRNASYDEFIDAKDGLLLLWDEVYNSNLSRKTTFEAHNRFMQNFPYVNSDYILYLAQAASRTYIHRVLDVNDGSEISDISLSSFGQPYTGEFIYSRNGEVVFYNQWDDYGGSLTVKKLDITNKKVLPTVLKNFYFSRQNNRSIVIGETSGYIYVIYRYSTTDRCEIRGFETSKTSHTVREYKTELSKSNYFNKLNAASNGVICAYDSVRNVFTFFDSSLSIIKEINNPFDNINAGSRMFIDKDDNYYLFDNVSKKMIVCDNNLNIKYEQIVPVNTNYEIERIKYDQSINQAYLIFKEDYYIRKIITISI